MKCSARYDHMHIINDSFYKENITLIKAHMLMEMRIT